MIPADFIAEWRAHARSSTDEQVEQDLALSRALVEIHVTRALFEENLAGKADRPAFTEDVQRLLPPGVTFDAAAGAERIQRELVALLPGDPWQGKPRP